MIPRVEYGDVFWCVEALNWEQHGYWGEPGSEMPIWYPDKLALAKLAAPLAKPAVIASSLEPMGGHFVYTIKDVANPWCVSLPCELYIDDPTVDGLACATKYVEKRHYTDEPLHAGLIDCLIHYARTGVATMPNWMPDGSLVGYRNGKKVKLYKRLNEAQGGKHE